MSDELPAEILAVIWKSDADILTISRALGAVFATVCALEGKGYPHQTLPAEQLAAWKARYRAGMAAARHRVTGPHQQEIPVQ